MWLSAVFGAISHRRCMDHKLVRQTPGAGRHRFAQVNGPQRLCLDIDRVAALAANRARHARAQRQIRVGGVHDCIHVRLLGYVATSYLNFHGAILAARTSSSALSF